MPTRIQVLRRVLCALAIGVVWVVPSSLARDGGVIAEKHYLEPPRPVSTEGLSRDERKIVQAFERMNGAVVVLLTQEAEITEEAGQIVLQPGKGIGTGVVISDSGDILTAAHVVRGASNVKARLLDGSEAGVSVVFSDPSSDVAVVRLSTEHPEIRPAILGDSDHVQIGQTILVIGVPLGAEHSLSVGHISARRQGNEFFGGAVEAEMLQTDAAVNQGNSGGPLVNLRGEVVGIVSRILTTTGGSVGLGFAVASNEIKKLLGEEPAPWIGANALFLGPDLVRALHIPSEGALLVQNVVEGSPAEHAGVRGGDLPAIIGNTHLVLGGDVILSIEEQKTCHRECVLHEIRSRSEATTVALTLWRDGHEIRVEIPVERPHILKRSTRAIESGQVAPRGAASQ